MYRPRTKRPFTVELKSSRQIPRRQEAGTLWQDVDLAAALELVSQNMESEASPPPVSTDIKQKTS
ncbi:hypothetical protein DSM25558_3191 [Agrobacterium sp. DSM 25558]|uniref:Uncharacterized protein n=1 Tax=Agrobacterium rosae TaxID=1972867 RepID=A0A1R3U2E7_9HYPH|nr:hypothetical protein DSM25558_3191 [Agrobacterium sp. DSM 25558]SCX35589.1 hypothetical protein DSM25559_5042 [Agrobacterium rosae]